MFGHLGKYVVAAMLVFVLAPREARAQVSDHAQCGTTLPACTTLRTNCCTRDFEGSSAQKAILIPMDRCHQPFGTGGDAATVSNAAPAWCADSPTRDSNAMNRAYGLVYRLMQNNIPVYWIVNPTKAPATNIVNTGNTSPATTPDARTKNVDFWVLSSTGATPTPTGSLNAIGVGTSPIKRMTISSPGTASATLTVATTYSMQEFAVRGGAFVIAPNDRTAFDNFHKTQLGRTGCGTTGRDCYDFRDVFYYEVDPSAVFVWQDYTQPLSGGKYVEFQKQLPVTLRIDYEPPKVAVLSSGALLSNFLQAAALNDLDSGACAGAPFTLATKAVGCSLAESDVNAGDLKAGGFNFFWNSTSPSACVTTNAQIKAYQTAVLSTCTPPCTPYSAGNSIFFDNAIQDSAEQCVGDLGAGLGQPGAGLATNNGAINESSANPLIVRYPANLIAQYGDLDLNFSSGTVTNWARNSGATNLYNAAYNTAPVTLRRLMTYENTSGTDCSSHFDNKVVGGVSTGACDDTAVAASADVIDLFAYGRYLNSANNGLLFYSPGNNLTPGGQQAQLRMVLSSLLAIPPFIVDQTFSSIEVSRANPIIANVGGSATQSIVQGTYVYNYDTGTDLVQRPVPRNAPSVYVQDDVPGFTFPALQGHVRAVTTASFEALTGIQTLAAGTAVFDTGAASTIPTVSFSGCAFPAALTCRNMWTTTQPGFLATSTTNRRVVLADTDATVGAMMLPDDGPITFNAAARQSFIQRIMQGWDPQNTGTRVAQIGGVDRSTVAVIGVSPTSGQFRPTIIYAGSTDGMLHAICANNVGPCQAGKELWAYIPRVLLPTLRFNTARIDGSVRVLDVNANFYGTGKSFRTVLLFQTGQSPAVEDEVPTIYALDVSDPTDPRVLWEHAAYDASGTGTAFAPTLAACPTQVSCGSQTFTSVTGLTPSSRGVYALGEGLMLASGQATIAGVTKNLVIAQTNNGGTGAAANVITAIDIENGARIWQRVNKLDNFVAPRVAATINVPSTGVPPGVVPIDKTLAGLNGFMTDIVAGDLYGNLWLIDPVDGTSQVTAASTNEAPIFQFTTDYHPLTQPAIYVTASTNFAVFTTGGYTDYSTNTLWGANTTTQYLISVDLNQTAGLPLTELSAVGSVPINVPLVNRGNGFSQARVVGDEIFVTTDTSNVNSATYGSSGTATGFITAYDLSAGAADTVFTQTRTGGTSIINNGVKLYASGGSDRQLLSRDADNQTDGDRTTPERSITRTIKKLWLRTE